MCNMLVCHIQGFTTFCECASVACTAGHTAHCFHIYWKLTTGVMQSFIVSLRYSLVLFTQNNRIYIRAKVSSSAWKDKCCHYTLAVG